MEALKLEKVENPRIYEAPMLYQFLCDLFYDIELDKQKNYINLRATSKFKDEKHIYEFYSSVDDLFNRYLDLRAEKKWNLYVSHSTFYIPKRAKNRVRRYNTFFADIDPIRGKSFDVNVMVEVLQKEFFGTLVPPPTYLNCSGNGVQGFWMIEHAPFGARWKWEPVEQRILDTLSSITEFIPTAKIDRAVRDSSRLTRVVETDNFKGNGVNQTYVIIHNDVRYTIDEIVEGYFPDMLENELKDKKAPVVLTEEDIARIQAERDEKQLKRAKYLAQKEKKEAKNKTKSEHPNLVAGNPFQLLKDRMSDYYTLGRERGEKIIGYRKKLLFVATHTAITRQHSLEEITQIILDLNNSFKVPKTEERIRGLVEIEYNVFHGKSLGTSEERRLINELKVIDSFGYYDRYRFYNDTLIDYLDITKEEQRQLKTIISDEVKKERENQKKRDARRDENGNLISRLPVVERRAKVKELMDKGYGYKRIATELGIPQDTAKNDVRALKK